MGPDSALDPIEDRRSQVVEVQEWADIRRMKFVDGLSIREIERRTGRHRDTIRRALASEAPPKYQRSPRPSKLDPYKQEILRLLDGDASLPSQRIREIITGQGYAGGRSICDDFIREARPYFKQPRTFQKTEYRPGEILQFDLWQPKHEIPVGFGQTRKGYVVVCALGFSRAGAGTLIFSKRAPDILSGLWQSIVKLGGVPDSLVIDREAALHDGRGGPSDAFAAFAGALPAKPVILAPRDCQAKGVVERLQGFVETSFEPGRSFVSHVDFQDQFDHWFVARANNRIHRILREQPAARLERERAKLRELPKVPAAISERQVLRVPLQPYVRVDANDYSIDPAMAGRRVEIAVSQQRITARELSTSVLAADHRRVFARGIVITDPAHQRKLDAMRDGWKECQTGRRAKDVEVEIRDLSYYDELVA